MKHEGRPFTTEELSEERSTSVVKLLTEIAAGFSRFEDGLRSLRSDTARELNDRGVSDPEEEASRITTTALTLFFFITFESLGEMVDRRPDYLFASAGQIYERLQNY